MQSTRRRNSLLAKTESLLPARVIAALGIRGFSWNSRKLKRYALMQR